MPSRVEIPIPPTNPTKGPYISSVLGAAAVAAVAAEYENDGVAEGTREATTATAADAGVAANAARR